MSGPYERNHTMFHSTEYNFPPKPPKAISYKQINEVTFPRALDATMGFGVHRSGWTECVETLSKLRSKYVIDDFVEQTFLARRFGQFHDRPFIGCFHYPPDDEIPNFATHTHDIRYATMFATEAWQKSLPHLTAAIAFTEHLAHWLRPLLSIPVFAVKHPTNIDIPLWSVDAFLERPSIVQVGAFYRDTRAITRLETSLPRSRILDLSYDWINGWDMAVANNIGPLIFPKEILHVDRVGNIDYDAILSRSIISTTYLAASASNVVVECIARRTPLLVNRIPPIQEYLGAEYPLYLQDIEARPKQLLDRALEANKYLGEIKQDWLSHKQFGATIEQIERQL